MSISSGSRTCTNKAISTSLLVLHQALCALVVACHSCACDQTDICTCEQTIVEQSPARSSTTQQTTQQADLAAAYPVDDAILDSLIRIKVLWSADGLLYLLWLMVCVLAK